MIHNRIFAAITCTAMLLFTVIPTAPMLTVLSAYETAAEDSEQLSVDLTGEGITNIVDLIVMQKFMLGRLKLPEKLLEPMDVNGDGDVNAFDLAVFKRCVVQ